MAKIVKIVSALILSVTLLLVICLIGGCGSNKAASKATSTSPANKPISGVNQKTTTDWMHIADEKGVFGGDETQRITDVAVGGPGIVAVGQDYRQNSLAVWISEDAVNWTRLEVNNFDGGCEITGDYEVGRGIGEPVIAAGPSRLVVAAGLNIWVSQDGLKWRKLPKNEAAFGGQVKKNTFSLIPLGIHDITASGTGFIAVGSGGYWKAFDTWSRNAVVWLSPDGIDWERLPHDMTVFGGKGTQEMYAIASSNQGFIAAGRTIKSDSASDAVLWVSDDGKTWVRGPQDDAVFGGKGWQSISDITSGQNGFVAVGSEEPDSGNDSHAAIWRSGDGKQWTRVPNEEVLSATGNPCTASRVLAYEQGYIIIGQEMLEHQKLILTLSSKDGLTWIKIPFKATGNYIDYKANGIVSFRSGLVIVGEENRYGDINGAVWVSGNLFVE